MEYKYLHICPKNDLAKILESKVLDNSLTKDNLNYSGVGIHGIDVSLGNKKIPIRAFLYDINKITESGCFPTFPNIGNEKTAFVGFNNISDIISLGFNSILDTSKISAIVFNISKTKILDQYLRFQDGQKYIESFSISPIKLINPVEAPIDLVMEEVFGCQKPFRLYGKRSGDKSSLQIMKASRKYKTHMRKY